MPQCNNCLDPAVKSFIIGSGENPRTHLCYVHAAEASLLELPMETISSIADETGYPMNGIAFVLEALCRAETLQSESEVSAAVVKSARERFSKCAQEVLAKWKITDKKDIGQIVFALAENQLVRRGQSIKLSDFERPFSLGDILKFS